MYSYAIAPEADLCFLRYEGAVTGQESIRAIRDVHADPQWHRGMDLVCDYLGVHLLDIVPDELYEVFRLRTEDVTGRDACVVRRELDETIARLYQRMAEAKGKEAHVCHTLDEAFAALGVSDVARTALSL